MSYKRLSLLAVVFAMGSFLSGCGGKSTSPVVSAPVVSVTASVSSVDGADTLTLTATVTNDKGADGVTWSVSGGGTLSNTTPASATYTAPAGTTSAQTVIVTATSVADSSKTGSVTLTIPAKPAITPPSGPQLNGAVGTAYSLQLAGTGGIAPYTWTLTGGTLPTGWTLTTGGLLSGPAPVAGQAGTIDLTVKVTDSGTPTALTATLQLTVTIAPAPAITFTGAMPASVTYKSAYAGSAAASGGAGTLVYSLASGSGPLPTGLSANANTGAITGTATAAGAYPFTIKAADAYGDSATQAYAITVNPATPTLAFTAIPTHTFGDSAFTASASSASGGVLTYSVTSGPATINSSTGLVTLSGAGTVVMGASQLATTNYTAATASTSFAVNKGTATVVLGSLAQTYTGSPLSPTVTTNPANLTVNFTYGGSPTTPTAAGSYAVVGTINDANYSGSANGTLEIAKAAATINVAPYSVTYDGGAHTAIGTATGVGGVNLTADLILSGSTHTNAGTYAGDAWSFADPSGNYASASGTVSDTISKAKATINVTPYTVTYDSTAHTATATATGIGGVNLIAGLTLSGTTHTDAGTYAGDAWSFADPSGNYANANGTVSDTINGAAPGLNFAPIATMVFGAPPAGDAPFTVSAASVSAGTIGYSVTSGPATINGNTVTLTGTGMVTLGASQVANGNYASTTTSTSFQVNPALSITTTTLPTGAAGVPYSQQLQATGGAGAYMWATNDAGKASLLALGLSLSSSGLISGSTPIVGGPASITVEITDNTDNLQAPHHAWANLSVTVTTIAITSTTLPTAYTGSAYSQQLTSSGGAGGNVWTVSGAGNLATYGLTLSTSGLLSGTVPSNVPSGISVVTFTVQVKDSINTSATKLLTITVFNPLTLPVAGALHAAITNADYGANNVGINASGGSGLYSFSVNGTSIPTTGQTTIANADSLTGAGSGGSTLSLGGTPTNSGTITLNVTVTDTGVTPNQSYGPIQYTILAAPQQLLALPDPSTHPLPTPVNINDSYNAELTATGAPNGVTYSFSVQIGGITTTVLTDNSQITLINGDGLIAQNNGGNILTISGTPTTASSITLLVTVNDSANDPAASQSYTIAINDPSAGNGVSGTVNYSGSKTGWVYLQLVPNSGCSNCGGNLGTAINASSAGSLASSGMAFTIHGVPPGTYTLQAWMDNTSTDAISGEVMGGYGGKNASNPTGVGNASVVVTSGTTTAANVTLFEPTTPTLGTATPNWNPRKGFGVFAGGAFVSYDPIADSNGLEIPNSYIVQWNISSNFSARGGSQCFPATGAQQPWIIGGITDSAAYYFRAAGVIGSCLSGTVGTWSAPTSIPYIIQDPKPAGGNPASGSVTFSQTATGPLYVGFFDRNTGNIYAVERGRKVAPPPTGISYSVEVPAGSNFFNFGVVDQKNQGLMIPGTISNVYENPSQTTNIINGGNHLGTLALPSANSIATVTTQGYLTTDINGNRDFGYSVNLRVNGIYKQPASVLLQSGPSYLTSPQHDIATAEFNGNFDEWDFSLDTDGTRPGQGDVFTFNVTYTDGTLDSTLNSTPNPITASTTHWPPPMPDVGSPSWGTTNVTTTPSFKWNYPGGASSYTYQFQLKDSTNNIIWSIPSQNDISSGFPSSIAPSITWGVDPLGGTNTPSVPCLSGSSTYYWSIRATDTYGNETTAQMAFKTASTPMSLIVPGTGSAVVGGPFSESLYASGGTGTGYVFMVNGSLGTTDTNNVTSWALGDGLTASTTVGSYRLAISGTPTSVATAPPLTLTVWVKDSQSNADAQGTVIYSIDVYNALTITTNSLNSAIYGSNYSAAIMATGGSGSYAWAVNGVSIPTTGVATALAGGGGLTGANNGRYADDRQAPHTPLNLSRSWSR